jgi:hypothetical protein
MEEPSARHAGSTERGRQAGGTQRAGARSEEQRGERRGEARTFEVVDAAQAGRAVRLRQRLLLAARRRLRLDRHEVVRLAARGRGGVVGGAVRVAHVLRGGAPGARRRRRRSSAAARRLLRRLLAAGLRGGGLAARGGLGLLGGRVRCAARRRRERASSDVETASRQNARVSPRRQRACAARPPRRAACARRRSEAAQAARGVRRRGARRGQLRRVFSRAPHAARSAPGATALAAASLRLVPAGAGSASVTPGGIAAVGRQRASASHVSANLVRRALARAPAAAPERRAGRAGAPPACAQPHGVRGARARRPGAATAGSAARPSARGGASKTPRFALPRRRRVVGCVRRVRASARRARPRPRGAHRQQRLATGASRDAAADRETRAAGATLHAVRAAAMADPSREGAAFDCARAGDRLRLGAKTLALTTQTF